MCLSVHECLQVSVNIMTQTINLLCNVSLVIRAHHWGFNYDVHGRLKVCIGNFGE